MDFDKWTPVLAAIVATIGVIWSAKIQHDNKPIKDILKRTKIEGDGSLVEALGIIQAEYRDSQKRHRVDFADLEDRYKQAVKVMRDQIVALREEIRDKDERIAELEAVIRDHEQRLDEGHIGKGK